MLMPSLSTSTVIGASARIPRRDGRSHRRGDGPPGATQGRATRWSSRAGRAADRELEAAFFSRTAICGRRDDVTSVVRKGDDVDDPDMSLQSTTALATSPLHDDSGDGSSLEETSRSPAFRLLMRLSFRSVLVISRSLCWALRAARRLFATALFRLKIASSERGALAGMRRAHLNCKKRDRRLGRRQRSPRRPESQRRAQIRQNSWRRR
jgi:hypothetical protein